MHFEVKIKFSRIEEKELSQVVLQYKQRLITVTELCNLVMVMTKGAEVQSIDDDGSITVVMPTEFPSSEALGCNMTATATIHPSTQE